MAVLVGSDPESAAAPRLSPVIVPWGSALRYARSEYQQHATLRLALMEPRVGSPLLRPTSVIALLDTQVCPFLNPFSLREFSETALLVKHSIKR